MDRVLFITYATGKYLEYVKDLQYSFRMYCTLWHEWHVFTDGLATEKPDVFLQKFELIKSLRNKIVAYQYVFYIDADMYAVAPIDDRILQPVVGVLHPSYYATAGTPERNEYSAAYMAEADPSLYFHATFWGGLWSNTLRIATECSKWVERDRQTGNLATWHDESYLNKYFHLFPPSIILPPSYSYHENRETKFAPILVHRVKQ